MQDFRVRWAAHVSTPHRTGKKRVHHPVVGEIELTFEAMDLTAGTGLTMHVYTVEPGSSSADALALLASWASLQRTTAPAAADARRRPEMASSNQVERQHRDAYRT